MTQTKDQVLWRMDLFMRQFGGYIMAWQDVRCPRELPTEATIDRFKEYDDAWKDLCLELDGWYD